MSRIALHRPLVGETELRYITQAVVQRRLGRDGQFTQRCSELLEQRFGALRVLMTSSCTAALEMASILSGLGPGDEAIVPSYTYVSTASAICRLGARPVFVDIRPDTLNLDESLVEDAITPRTRAIFPVHYSGVGCELDAIMEIARRHDLLVVEDAAQGVNARYQNRPLGTLGHLGAYSFHETKNYTCGEGGALLINSPELLERSEILRDNGTNRAKFLRGQIAHYSWVDLGSSYALNEIAAAFLLGQLEQMDESVEQRSRIFRTYLQGLLELERQGYIQLPCIPNHCHSNYHIFYLLVADSRMRNGLIDHLNRLGIQATFHFVPLHQSPMGKKLGSAPRPLPVSEDASERLVRLPIYGDLSSFDQARVIDGLFDFFRSTSSASPLRSNKPCNLLSG